jgi:hypothetical protein
MPEAAVTREAVAPSVAAVLLQAEPGAIPQEALRSEAAGTLREALLPEAEA